LAAQRLEAHSGEVLDRARAGRLAVEHLITVVASVVSGLLA
jgi:hypothetical protein